MTRSLSGFIPRLWGNWLSLLGTVITTVGGLTLLVTLVITLAGGEMNAYASAFLLLGSPFVFIFGLLLIPLGLWLERRRTGPVADEEASVQASFAAMLKRPIVRKRLLFVLGATLINVVLVAAGAQKAMSYMDSPKFCGTTCHVMQPQYDAYSRSPHSRVACVQCHIGPGASWAVKAKVDGVRQVIAMFTGSYSKPIVGPIHDLRPARDTCEQCHWPAVFHGNRLAVFPHRKEDKDNTLEVSALMLKIGGRSPKTGEHVGIHWHVSPDAEVRYEVQDKARERVGTIRVYKKGKLVDEYRPPKAGGKVLAVRTMDCVDCHNRPTHVFDGTPAQAVDMAFAQGLLDPSVPWLRQMAAQVLKAEMPDRDKADGAFRQALAAAYTKAHPQDKPSNKALDAASRAMGALYRRNVYPAMNVKWNVYRSEIGHREEQGGLRGCFRCHDGEHKTKAGKALSQDCELCHAVISMEATLASVPDFVKPLVAPEAAK